jgi:hypothetical protein
MKLIGTGILLTTILSVGIAIGLNYNLGTPLKPSDILGFYPICDTSPKHLVRAAQAECVRHEIPCVIDGEPGPQTYKAICELLYKLEYEGE